MNPPLRSDLPARRLRLTIPLLLALSLFALSVRYLISPPVVRGISSTVVISEFRVRGPSGGNDEFVELYNLSGAPINIGGWKIKGSNNSGTNSTRATVPAGTMIGPGCFFLAANSAANGYSGSTPGNVTYTTGVTDDGGLALTQADDTIVDQVGMSAGSAFKEGTILASLGSANQNRSYERKPGGAAGHGADTDDNASDFQLLVSSNPQNASSPCIVGGGPTTPTGVGTATPNLVTTGNSTLLTVAVSPGTNPTSTNLAVSASLISIGGAATQGFFDDGTNGDATAGDNIFSYQATVASDSPAGSKSLPATITDAQGRTGNTTISLTVAPPPLAINAIQGNGSTSPFNASLVQTSGIVTGRKSNGFFLQTPEGQQDDDPLTSEGIFVFTSSAPPAAATVGNLVNVVGTVVEFAGDPGSPPLTEISNPTVALVSSGNTLPTPVTLTAADTPPNGGLDVLERLEGMRVHIASLTVVAPTQGSVSEANATASSNGVFYGVTTGIARPFREPGLQEPDPLPAGAPPTIPRFDANPERLRVDSDGIGAPLLNVATGVVISNLTGPLDYAFRTYTILPDPNVQTSLTPNPAAAPVPLPGVDEFTVASFNMQRFFDTVNDPGVSDTALTPAAFANRLNKASLTIRNILRTPDIIGVQEVENLTTLQAIAAKINADAVAAGDPDPNYVGYLVEGNDIGGIDVGFLVKTGGGRVVVASVTQEGAAATYIDPGTGQPALLNDRPPLVLAATVHHPAGPVFPVTVIVNHLRSFIDIEDPTAGPRVRAKRNAQAEFLANLIQARQSANPNESIISLGDYNAFQFNDGYVDVIGAIKGTPASASEVTLASADLVNPDLLALVDYAPALERYSYTFDGNAQTIDHILMTGNLLPRLKAIHYGRSNADFPEVLRSDATRPERLSDHDIPIGYFTFPKANLAVTKAAASSTVSNNETISYAITVSNSTTDVAEGIVMTDPLPSGTTFVSAASPAGWTCDPLTAGEGGTLTCSTPSLGAGASATITLVVQVACETANGAVITNTASVGSNTLDPDPDDNSKSVQVTVSNAPPRIGVVWTHPAVLAPANHRMVEVMVNYEASDNCSAVSCRLSVSSNEPINGGGAGDLAPDWQVINSRRVRLRAERSDSGNGRVYTIRVTCTDNAGNTSTRRVEVRVP